MKQLVIIFSIVIACIINIPSYAQGGTVLNPDTPPRDGYYDKIHYPSRRVVPYPYLREGDIMWTRRVWRAIDLREKINQPMYYPTTPTNLRKSLIYILQDAVCGTETQPPVLVGYDPGQGDDFKVTLTAAEIKSIGATSDTVKRQRPFPPYEDYDTIETTVLRLEDIKKYEIKEDWYFERQRSVMEPRILGICPVVAVYDPGTLEFRGYRKMYWLYFPHIRKVLINEEVYNPYNFGARITFDDLFMKRQFSSLIYKVDNTYDRKIEEYVKGIDALLEAENIKDIIFKFEHDVWEQ